MLRNVKHLRGYALRGSDGFIGRVEDFYFDDDTWAIRYLVVETGTWLSGRKVLISPIALGHAGWMGRQLPVALTRAQLQRSPDIDIASLATSSRDECHLRSSNTVIGHHIEATDGDVGHVEDLLVDDHTWAIRHLIVNTSNWWGGQRVLIAPHSIKDVNWCEAKICVGLSRQAVKDAPAYISAAQVDRESEPINSEHYGGLGIRP